MKKLSIAVAVILLTASCKKTNVPPVVVNQDLTIKLNTQYLPAAKIDSAMVTWDNGTRAVTKKMVLRNDSLVLPLQGFDKGDGTMTIQLFTQAKLKNENLQWEKRFTAKLETNSSFSFAAPTGYTDADWNPRVILIDGFTQLTAIVALRPEDSYFQVKNIPAAFPKVELERNYTRIPGGAEIIAGGTWKCNNCAGANVENRNFFEYQKNLVAGKQWAMVEVGVGLFGNTPVGGAVLYFNYY